MVGSLKILSSLTFIKVTLSFEEPQWDNFYQFVISKFVRVAYREYLAFGLVLKPPIS